MRENEKFVIFGTGPLGLSVMDALVEKAKEDIILVNRSGTPPESLPEGVRLLSGDATNPDQVARLAKGASVVFHCAQPGYTEWFEKFPPITRGILEGTARTGAKLVFGDNLYMYGHVDGPLHEELPNAAQTRKGRVRAEMAEMLLDAHRVGKIDVAIGRAPDFYGPRVLGSVMGDRVFPAVLRGKSASLTGNPDLPHTYTYIKDFGRALVTLSENEVAFGQVWHVPSAETITTRALVNIAFEEAGYPPKISAMGKMMMRIGGLFVPEARETVEMMYEFENDFIVDHAKFAEAFGASPTPHREAIKETLDWYRQHEN